VASTDYGCVEWRGPLLINQVTAQPDPPPYVNPLQLGKSTVERSNSACR